MRLSLFGPIDRWLAPAPPAGKADWIGRWIYAHRGLHLPGVPENSLAAAKGAIERGFGIECDIQRSLDNVPMVFHDWDLKRLIGMEGQTATFTAAELMDLRYPQSGEGPITLPDLLTLVAGQAPFLIEIKSRQGYDVERICSRVRTCLDAYRGLHSVMSFDPRVSHWFARHSPETVRGLVVTEEGTKGLRGDLRRHMALWHAKPDFLAYDVRDLPSRFAASQRERGLPVATWTVRSPDLLDRARLHADAPIAEGAGIEPRP
ncbi:MAG: glycerophosphodiester phosphodiesterase [Alphaproteobacteria bacterium]|nr:glycerophosphodiester phosphodiesterase [Alphaproteobacteria bacterium]